MAGKPRGGGEAKQVDNDLDSLLMGAMFLIFGYMMFAIISQYLAFIARYIYAFFNAPIYAVGEAFGRIGSSAVMFFYSLVGLGFWVLFKYGFKGSKKGMGSTINKKSTLMMTYCILWVSFACAELVTGHEDSLMTMSMRTYCNPESSGLLAIFSCQNSANDIGTQGVLSIIISSLFPNLILAASSFAQVVRGMFNLSDHPKSRAKKRFNVDTFIRDQKDLYPHLKVYDIINPNEIDAKSGQLRLMDNARRLCYENDLIRGFTRRPDNTSDGYGKQFNEPINLNPMEVMPDVDMDELVPVIDQKKFEVLMLEQLGKIYSGIESLNAGQIILLGICLPRACSVDANMSEEEANAVNQEHFKNLDYVWDWVARDIKKVHDVDIGLRGFDKLDEYKEIVAEWIEKDIAKKLVKQHAYINTLVFRVISEAKRVGVCQPSSFRWLKFYDRQLWSVVQNVDRPSVFAENIAVVSHFMMEKKARTMINQPMFQAAYNGLVDNIQKYKFPLEKVEAWDLFKKTGDNSLMIELNMIGSDNAQDPNADEDEIELAEISGVTA